MTTVYIVGIGVNEEKDNVVHCVGNCGRFGVCEVAPGTLLGKTGSVSRSVGFYPEGEGREGEA